MKTEFDLYEVAHPLAERLWFSRGSPEYWDLLASSDSRVKLHAAATNKEINALRHYIGGDLPPTLEEFLRHSNGLSFAFDSIVYSAESIIKQTEWMRGMDDFFPNDHLLFIGELGDGDMFAFGRTKKGQWESDVFWWEHETFSCYSCGSGIWDYVAKHASWRHCYMTK